MIIKNALTITLLIQIKFCGTSPSHRVITNLFKQEKSVE